MSHNRDLSAAAAQIGFNNSNIGIGSETPQNRLDVSGDIKILDNSPRLFLYDANANGASNATGGFEVFDKDGNKNVFCGAFAPNADNLIFGVTGTERVRIESSGFVGLGTDNPYHELHIQGSGDTRALITSGGTGDAVMMFENASGNTWGHGIDLTNNNYVIAYNNTSDPSLTADGILNITSAGRLGVGLASPNSNLHVKGGSESTDNLLLTLQSNGVANDGSLSTGLRLINSTADNSIHGADIRAIRTSGSTADLTFSLYDGNSPQTERLRITSSGFMGLRTNAPAIPLDVHGPDTNANGTGDVKGQLRVFNDTTAFGSSPRAGIVFSTKYRTSPDVPLDGAAIYGGKLNGSDANKDFFLAFATRSESPNEAVERMRIEKSGPISSNPNSADGDDFAAMALKNDWNAWVDIFYEGWISANNGWGTFWAGSTGAAYRRVSGDTNPNEYVFVGAGGKRFTFDLDVGGNAYFDGSLSQNNYDYAEYFEWEDGNPNNEDRRGYSVFLNANGKIEKATTETNTSDIIGVISGTAAIIGDAAVYDWQGRYEIDEWGTRRKEQVTQVSWTDIDGTKHSYADENDVPSGIVIPDDASRRIHHRYIESSTYDSSQAYVPRDQRGEWGIVGLLGKVRVRNDSPKHPNWKYIKTIAGKDLWLIK
jgi:hypothetical protein